MPQSKACKDRIPRKENGERRRIANTGKEG